MRIGITGLLALVLGCQGLIEVQIEGDRLYSSLIGGLPFDGSGLAPIVTSRQSFYRVGFLWDADPSTELQGRFRDLQGQWTDFRPLITLWSEGRACVGLLDVEEARASAFQLRLAAGSAPTFLYAQAVVRLGEIEGFKNPMNPYQNPRLAPPTLANPRQMWAAREPMRLSPAQFPRRITIHHTGTPSAPDEVVAPEVRLRQIQAFHIDAIGLADIGYHFVIDLTGAIWQGRDENSIGAHTPYYDQDNVGIAFLGTFNGAVQPTQAQLDSAETLLRWLRKTYPDLHPLSSANVKGQRDYYDRRPGESPGDNLYSRIGILIARASSG